MNQHTFLSENGNLYFSEVQAIDAAEYTCIVTLTTSSDAVLASSQPLYGNSLGIQLNIAGEGQCGNNNEYLKHLIAGWVLRAMRLEASKAAVIVAT